MSKYITETDQDWKNFYKNIFDNSEEGILSFVWNRDQLKKSGKIAYTTRILMDTKYAAWPLLDFLCKNLKEVASKPELFDYSEPISKTELKLIKLERSEGITLPKLKKLVFHFAVLCLMGSGFIMFFTHSYIALAVFAVCGLAYILSL